MTPYGVTRSQWVNCRKQSTSHTINTTAAGTLFPYAVPADGNRVGPVISLCDLPFEVPRNIARWLEIIFNFNEQWLTNGLTPAAILSFFYLCLPNDFVVAFRKVTAAVIPGQSNQGRLHQNLLGLSPPPENWRGLARTRLSFRKDKTGDWGESELKVVRVLQFQTGFLGVHCQ